MSFRIPIIKFYDNLIVPIQMAVSDDIVVRLKDDLTERLRNGGATGLVIDVSGVDILDSFISRTIRDLGVIARLLGVETAICGLDPMMAITMLEMGMDLEGVHTVLNLEEAIELLDELRAGEGASPLDRGGSLFDRDDELA